MQDAWNGRSRPYTPRQHVIRESFRGRRRSLGASASVAKKEIARFSLFD
jgi:hypothetical protein